MDFHPDILNNAMVQAIARTDFQTAHRRGFWRKVTSWFTNQDNSLLPFDEVVKQLPICGQHYLGMREIPIHKVIGSVGRYHDFDRAFLPLRTHTKNRWMSIDTAHLRDVILPPIEVYKIGEAYFVKDGNHRVSVAREKGQYYIDADVIELDIDVPFDSDLTIGDIIRKREQSVFYDMIDKGNVLPGVEFELSAAGAYNRLLEHIEVHRWFMGEARGTDVTLNEAIISWYSDVYKPLVDVIREQNIMDQFPGRTDADLYLWIIEHLQYLREKYCQDISLEEAAAHFAGEYAPGFFKRIARFFHGGKEPIKPNKKMKPPKNSCN
jgi:hypothetical protein